MFSTTIRPPNLLKMALLLFFFLLQVTIATASNFTATFFFGDSTLDTGNNNFISTPFQGNHAPYGANFPHNRAPTGRFCDGLLVSDLLTSSLGIKPLSPPYLDPNLSDEEIRTGVNFASAGSGYDDLTSTMSNTVPMSRQLKMFEEYVGRLKGVVGEEEGRRVVGGGLVMFSSGGNDVLLNFYDSPRRRLEYNNNMSAYQDFLHGILKDAVKTVYNHGGRKFIVAGLPPIGCLPLQITLSFYNTLNRECVDEQISDTIAYNTKLRNLVPELQKSLPESRIAYLDITDSVFEIIQNPEKYGFEESRKGCCGTGFIELGPLCNKYTPVCENMSSFVFFDAIHPSERINKLVTEQIMNEIIPELY